MTEQEWLASTDPAAILQWVTGSAHGGHAPSSRALDRHLRLFAAGCCRRVWGLLTDERSQRSVEIVEQMADGATHPNALYAEIHAGAQIAMNDTPRLHGDRHEAAWMALACSWHSYEPKVSVERIVAHGKMIGQGPIQAALLRDIVGPAPFRRVVVLPRTQVPCPECSGRGVRFSTDRHGTRSSFRPASSPCPKCRRGKVDGPCPWLTPDVLAIAGGIYAERAFAECPVLADALEDAGCDSEPLLRHLRGQPEPWVRLKHCGVPEMDLECVECGVRLYGQEVEKVCRYKPTPPGVHVRGCWALDLLLGKA